jgi:hypothetical protein
MNKGQDAPMRKTVFEALYGNAGSGEAGNHLALLHMYEQSSALLKFFECPTAPNEASAADSKADAATAQKLRQRISELKPLIFASWEKIVNQPETLRRLARAAEQKRDHWKPPYETEVTILSLYRNGVRSYEKLFAYVAKLNPEITASTFSKIVKRYKLTLEKGRPGRKAKTR